MPSVIFGDGAVPVCSHQGAQIVNLHLQLPTDVGIGDALPKLLTFKNFRRVGNAVVVPDRLFPADKRLMGDDAVGLGGADERVTGNAGGGLVSLAETAVNDQELPAALDGAFPLADLDGNMTVDDMTMGPFQAEFLQNEIADCRILIERVIGVLRLRPGAFAGSLLVQPPL